MCEFIDNMHDRRLAEQLTIAVRGRGAFARFKDVLGEAGPGRLEAYYAMAQERKLSRAASWLAENGYRAVSPSATA